MTHALLFVGYSLNDTNFRLLLDQQFTVFNGQVPPRYALLSGVGIAEEDILWQTARLQVLSYPDGQHQHVEQFLEKLADATTEKHAKIRKRLTPIPNGTQASKKYQSVATLILGIRNGHLFMEFERSAGTKVLPQAWACPVSAKELENLAVSIKKAIKTHEHKHSAAPEIAIVGDHLMRLLPSDLLRRLRMLKPGSPLKLACERGTHCIPWEWLSVSNQPLCLRQAGIALPCIHQ